MKIIKLKTIKTLGSEILKYLNKNNIKKKIKEIYFSEIKFGITKGWNKHTKTPCYLSVVYGKIEFYVFIPKSKKIKKFILSRKKFSLLKIPKNHWFKYRSIAKPYSILVNSIENDHSKKESQKKRS